MKYKLIYAAGVLFCIFLSFFLTLKTRTGNVWEHQHLEYEEEIEQNSGVEEFTSHLPVVSIETNRQEISGKEDLITVEVDIYDADKTRNRLSADPALSVQADIRYRENSTLSFDEKSYLLNFMDMDGNKREEEVMGMPAYDTWVLNSSFLDKSLMRNYLCMNISAEIMGYAPRVRYCEMFLDGVYQGVYLMMENVSVGEHRVNITPYEEGEVGSSYLIRAGIGDEVIKELNTFTKYARWIPANSGNNNFAITMEYPAKSNITLKLKEWIEQDLSRFEKSLYSYDYKDTTYGYQSFINTQSFVDYFIINEFFKNYDAGNYSTYSYKDAAGKINMGPVWDFNNAANNDTDTEFDETGFMMQGRVWYFMLIKDESFTEQIIWRYHELRKTYLKEEYLSNYIDEVQEFLGESINRNYEVCGYAFEPGNMIESSKLLPDERNPANYEEAVEQLKSFLIKRGNWMDEYIENLRQYSHESKNGKF